MMAEEWVLAATVFVSGLASGLLGMLCTIVRSLLATLDGAAFRDWMETFLQFAGKSWGKAYNFAWSIGMTIGPIVALVLLWDERGSTSFVLTAIGLAVVIVGVLIVSNVWKTPTYNLILAWEAAAMPTDWEMGRQRYFTINWIQLAATWSAFVLFILALGLL